MDKETTKADTMEISGMTAVVNKLTGIAGNMTAMPGIRAVMKCLPGLVTTQQKGVVIWIEMKPAYTGEKVQKDTSVRKKEYMKTSATG